MFCVVVHTLTSSQSCCLIAFANQFYSPVVSFFFSRPLKNLTFIIFLNPWNQQHHQTHHADDDYDDVGDDDCDDDYDDDDDDVSDDGKLPQM